MINHSIKRFLLTHITLSILVIYTLISFSSYSVSKEELDELYDANLQQVAKTIAAQYLAMPAAQQPYMVSQVGVGKKIEGEEEFYVRVLAKNGHVLFESHSDVHIPSTTKLGFSTQSVQRKQWRLFTINAQEHTIQVAQSLKKRQNTIQETANSLMISQLLFIPILVLLIFYAVRKAFSPLSALSKQIQQRASVDLKPFVDDSVPIEIKPLVQSLNLFMGKVSFMVDVLKRFTSDAAHELRTPITALKLQLTVLEQSKSELERESAIKNLKFGIKRSEQLVSQLLTLAKLEPDNYSRLVQPLNMHDLVKESFQDLLPMAQEKSIDIGLVKIDYCALNAVHQDIKILINNILDNAIRYTPEGGKIDVSVFKQADHVVLEVRDSGPGIPEDDHQRVFERFYRGENQNIPGSGLGLAIVKEISTQNGATIELSNLNPGLCFKVSFVNKVIFS